MKLGLNNSATNYYPFGMIMPGRVFTSSTTYKFGYQCSLKDDEITVAGGSYGTFHRELDVRGDHWWSIDPETKAWESPYVSMGDNPIRNNDVRGNSATDWVKGKDGHARYDKNVHKKEDVKIGDEYLGKNIFMHDKSTGTTYYWEQDKLKAVHLSEVTISAARTPSTPLDRAMGQAIEAYQSPPTGTG